MHLTPIRMDFLLLFLFLGGLQGLLLALVLLTARRGNPAANRVRGVLVLIFSLHIIVHALGHVWSAIRSIHLNDFIVVACWLFGPLLLWYVKLLTVKALQWTRRDTLQLLPCAAAFALLLIMAWNYPEEPFHRVSEAVNRLMLLHLLGYLILTVRQVVQYAVLIKKTRASWGNLNLTWLRSFVVQSILIWTAAIVLKFFDWAPRSGDIFLALVSLYIYWNVYTGLKQPEILSIDFDEELIKKKYQKTSLDPERATEYLQKLEAAMERDKLFLQNDISLPHLAGQLGVSVHHMLVLIGFDVLQIPRCKTSFRLK